MNRTEKEQSIENLNRMFAENPGIFLFGFSGINVPDVTELRAEINRSGNTYQVVKNRLAIRAARETAVEPIADFFRGPTAIAYCDQDPVALVKTVKRFAKTHPDLEFKAGVLNQTIIGPKDLDELAEMASREELLSKLAYLMLAPLTQFAVALQSPLRNMASALKQLSESKTE